MPEETISSVLDDFGVFPEESKDGVPRKVKDLAEANIAKILADMPSVSGSTEDSDGGWKHREGGSQLSDSARKRLLQRANELFKKYNLGKPSIRIVNLW